MTTYTWPSALKPASCTLEWQDNTARFVSPFSGATRTVNRPGGRWRLSMTFPPMKPETAQTLEAFLYRLDGGTHRAIIPDYSYQRQATGTGTVTVKGAGQTGRVVLTSGWTAGQTVMKAGDRFTLDGQMHVVVADAVASGGVDVYLLDEEGAQILDESSQPILIESGDCQLFLAHAMRESPADGAAISYTEPTAKYMLAERFEFNAVPGVIKTVQVVFDEVIE